MRITISAVTSVLLAVSTVLAAPRSSHRLHEKRDSVLQEWRKHERLHPDVDLPVRIGLTQQNLDRGHDLLMEVSEHDSPKYGQHYTADEVIEIFAPSKNTVDTVRAWLEDAGIHPHRISQSVNKQWMQFDAKAKELEALLKTKYHAWEHEPTGNMNVACDEYHVPEHVKEHVDYITPGIRLLSSGKKTQKKREEEKKKREETQKSQAEKRLLGSRAGLPPISAPLPLPLDVLLALPLSQLCGIAITPVCIKTLYGIPDPKNAIKGNDLGIFEDLGDIFAQQDLDSFFLTLAENIPAGTSPKVKAIDGAVAPTSVVSAGPESDLDLELAFPLIYPQGIHLFQTDDTYYESNYTYAGFLNNFLYAIDGSYCHDFSPLDPPYPDPHAGGYKGSLQCGKYKPTNVISISYGGQENDLPVSYQKRQCQEFMKLGLQGVSVVVASGDSGVSGPTGDACLGSNKKIFSPDFPATCPYITVLGATTLPAGANAADDGETAVTQFPSGGGFSNIYPIPSYQKAAVQGYLTNHTPPYKSYSTTNGKNIGANGGIYNSNGRAYPDFSAVGQNIIIFTMGTPNLLGGTSASTPIFASILTRINGERIAAGKSRIGFVNPVLYAHPDVLHDVTTGTNPGCGTNGFSCAAGWDPVSGLGTPKYTPMLNLFMGLP